MGVAIGIISTALLALSLGGGLGAWIHKRIVKKKRELPAIYWTGASLRVANNLDEYLIIETIIANGPIYIGLGEPNLHGELAEESIQPSPLSVEWVVSPNSEDLFKLGVGNTNPRISIIMSSSKRTFVSKRLAVYPSQKP